MRKPEVLCMLALAAAMSGCGVESASTAATAAAIKQKELEAGKKIMQEAEKQIGKSMQQLQQNVQKSGEAEK
jgi:hypothetical protein